MAIRDKQRVGPVAAVLVVAALVVALFGVAAGAVGEGKSAGAGSPVVAAAPAAHVAVAPIVGRKWLRTSEESPQTLVLAAVLVALLLFGTGRCLPGRLPSSRKVQYRALFRAGGRAPPTTSCTR